MHGNENDDQNEILFRFLFSHNCKLNLNEYTSHMRTESKCAEQVESKKGGGRGMYEGKTTQLLPTAREKKDAGHKYTSANEMDTAKVTKTKKNSQTMRDTA